MNMGVFAVNSIVAIIILIIMYVYQDDIYKKVRFFQYKSILKRNKKLNKDLVKKAKTINDIIDIIELYYKDNPNVIKYEKKILYTKVNGVHGVDISNYVVLIITLIITVFTTYYSLVGNMNITSIFNQVDSINTINQKITSELENSNNNEDRIKALYKDRDTAITVFNNQKKELIANFSINNDLFEVLLYVIVFILYFIIILNLANYLRDALISFRMLCLHVIEDVDKDKNEQSIKVFNTIEKAINNADETLEKCYLSLNKADTFLKELDNKNNLHNAVQELKSISIKANK